MRGFFDRNEGFNARCFTAENVRFNAKGVFVMTNTKSNLDAMLANLLAANAKKIQATTPVNPVIKKDDEWRNDTHWDKLYKELAVK